MMRVVGQTVENGCRRADMMHMGVRFSARGLTCLVVFSLLGLVVGVLPAQDADLRLRRGFREISLGLPFAAVQEALAADAAFLYRGEPDVSLRLSDGEQLIDTRGRVYMERGVFQFHNGQLFSMALYLNRQTLDYFQLYEQLRTRYGDPVELDPQRAYWQDVSTRIELERPLTVRYLDRAVFEERRRNARTLEAAEDISRERFLEEF